MASKDLRVVFKSESICELFTKTILKPTLHKTLSFSQEGKSVTYFGKVSNNNALKEKICKNKLWILLLKRRKIHIWVKSQSSTPPIPHSVPKRQASIPALHLTCTLSPKKSQTLFQTTFLTKIGDHALLITGQARVLQRRKGLRKIARKRPPGRNTCGRRKAKNLRWG